MKTKPNGQCLPVPLLSVHNTLIKLFLWSRFPLQEFLEFFFLFNWVLLLLDFVWEEEKNKHQILDLSAFVSWSTFVLVLGL